VIEVDNEIITSKDNTIIKLFRKLAASKKERSEKGLFVIEGLRIVSDALEESAPIKNILITQTALTKYPQYIINDKTLIISDLLAEKIAQTDTPQGVFAICEIPKETFSWNPQGKYIVLNELQDLGNAGMIIRTADALGIDGVILCNTCDIFSPKAARSAMGSLFRVKILCENNTENLFALFHSKRIKTYASVVNNQAHSVKENLFNNGCAVFIGNEGNGLSQNVIDHCDFKITIPMYGNAESLNAAMAAGILMWILKA